MNPWRITFGALVICLALSACSDSEPIEVGAIEVDTTVVASVPESTSPPDSLSTDSSAPVQPAYDSGSGASDGVVDGWRIGVDYIGSRLVVDGEELEASSVGMSFLGSQHMSLHGGGCGLGSGEFEWNKGAVTRWSRVYSLLQCNPSDQDVHNAVRVLSESDFVMSGSGDVLTLTSDRILLELTTSGLGERTVIADTERFVGVETDVPGIDPGRVQLEAPVYFVLVATLPTCQLNGGLTVIDEESSTVGLPKRPGFDECEFSPEEDQAARAFLQSEPTLTRNGDVITLVGDDGVLTLALASADDPAITAEIVPPPPLVNPDTPAREENANRGELSEPWFPERHRSGEFDIPLPPEWEAGGADVASASVVGRGGLVVERVAVWEVPGGETITEGPTPVTTATFEVVDGVVVYSGNVLTGSQYRLARNDSIVRTVVWVFPDDDGEIVASVSYPDFGALGSSPDSDEDPRNLTLTGLDPVELLKDVRIYE